MSALLAPSRRRQQRRPGDRKHMSFVDTVRTDRTAAARRATLGSLLDRLIDLGGLLSFLVMLVVFCAARPNDFATFQNFRTVFFQSATLCVVAMGLTVVLAIGEFDLSLGAAIGLSGAAAVLTMADLGQGTAVAILMGFGVGMVIGLVNGALTAYGRVPALIATLAVSSAALGINEALTHNSAIYTGVTRGYVNLSLGRHAGLPGAVWISFAVLAVVWFVLDLTTYGRRAYAVGANEAVAYLSGVRTKRVTLFGFVIVGLAAALGGILTTSAASSTFPNAGTPLLLPAYAAAFLGATTMPGRRFHPAGTYFGALFLNFLATGLLMLGLPNWTTDVVEGVVLGAAVLVTRLR
jgi:ribose transport system permease protein